MAKGTQKGDLRVRLLRQKPAALWLYELPASLTMIMITGLPPLEDIGLSFPCWLLLLLLQLRSTAPAAASTSSIHQLAHCRPFHLSSRCACWLLLLLLLAHQLQAPPLSISWASSMARPSFPAHTVPAGSAAGCLTAPSAVSASGLMRLRRMAVTSAGLSPQLAR